MNGVFSSPFHHRKETNKWKFAECGFRKGWMDRVPWTPDQDLFLQRVVAVATNDVSAAFEDHALWQIWFNERRLGFDGTTKKKEGIRMAIQTFLHDRLHGTPPEAHDVIMSVK